jgi:AraC-like DNA-binding protein
MHSTQSFNIHDINPYVIRCGHNDGIKSPYPLEVLIKHRYVQWFEVELVIEGNGYILHEGEKLELKKGRMFFRYPGMSIEPTCNYHSYYVTFDIVYENSNFPRYNIFKNVGESRAFESEKPKAKEIEQPFIFFDFPFYMDVIKFAEFEECFSSMYNEYVYVRKESPFLMKLYLMRLLGQAFIELSVLRWENNSSKTNQLSFNKIMRVKDYIDKNICCKFKLEEMAELAELSASCFCRTFKKIMNESPFEYINRNKINKSKKMLIETNLPLKTIVYDCGFENYAYFCTLFKKLEGTSPITYKKGHCLQFISL